MFKTTLTLALLNAMTAAVRLETQYSDDMFLGMACSVRAGANLRGADFDGASTRSANVRRD